MAPSLKAKKKEEMAEDVRSSWRKMKRIVIKMERGGVQGAFREASYHWRADTFWDKGKTFQEER